MTIQPGEIARAILDRRDEIAERIVSEQFERRPGLAQRYGTAGRSKCVQDALYHLSYLAEAIRASSPVLFADYAAWAKTLLDGLGIPAEDLVLNLECMRDAVLSLLSPESHAPVEATVEAGLAQISSSIASTPLLDEQAPLAALATEYLEMLLQGDRNTASRTIMRAAEDGTAVKDIYLRVFQPAQREIGRLWQTNRISVAKEHYCTAATQLIMSQLYPRIFATQKIGRNLVASCVGGELHEIGVRMVADFFEMEGWDTYYLGASTPAQSIVRAIKERGADILALSATMTFHVTPLAELIDRVRQANFDKPLKILVGGYPFNVSMRLRETIGADGCAVDAQEAVLLAEKWFA